MADRSGRPTRRFDSSELIALTKKPIVASEARVEQDDDPFVDWDDGQGVAAGSQSNALPTTSRTATLADPLTTGLLAEVARRTSTVELDPTTIAAAVRSTVDIDPETLAEVLREPEPAPPRRAQASTKRRDK